MARARIGQGHIIGVENMQLQPLRSPPLGCTSIQVRGLQMKTRCEMQVTSFVKFAK